MVTKHPLFCACKRCKAVDDVLAAALELAAVIEKYENAPSSGLLTGGLERIFEHAQADGAMRKAARRLKASLKARPQKTLRARRLSRAKAATPETPSWPPCGNVPRGGDGSVSCVRPKRHSGDHSGRGLQWPRLR